MHAEPRLAAAGESATSAAFVGQRIERLEDAALLSGRGAYADDVGVKPGTLHAAVLRSPHAHAKLLGIDASAALAASGVRAVLTGALRRRRQTADAALGAGGEPRAPCRRADGRCLAGAR